MAVPAIELMLILAVGVNKPKNAPPIDDATIETAASISRFGSTDNDYFAAINPISHPRSFRSNHVSSNASLVSATYAIWLHAHKVACHMQ